MAFLTLGEYLTGARKILTKQQCGHLTEDEDVVADVANKMMMADYTWNGSSTRETWRYNQAKYAIYKILNKKTKRRKKNIQSLDYGWDDPQGNHNSTLASQIPDRQSSKVYEQFIEICDLAENILTDRQLVCFNMYYKDHRSMDEIGKLLGITRAAVSLHIQNGKKKLKTCMSKSS